MIKPEKLKIGDTVAIVSLSNGMAGDEAFLWRTKQGIKYIEKYLGLRVKIMPNALKGSEYIYNNPKKRAEDLHDALLDKEVKAIVCCTGGVDSIRVTPYIDKNILLNNPKIFTGYSDTTVQHLMFYECGITSFYGPALLTDFAENNSMDEYTINSIMKCWFSNEIIGNIKTSPYFREFGLLWDEKNKNLSRKIINNTNYESLGSKCISEGKLFGGSLEVLSNLRGTNQFPKISYFKDSILFLETSESNISPSILEQYLRTFGMMGIFNEINGLIIGKPQNNIFYEDYKHIWTKIIKEFSIYDKPILYNASFGHNEPKFIIPYGIKARLNSIDLTFEILENSVL